MRQPRIILRTQSCTSGPGYKRTLWSHASIVRFTPESRHRDPRHGPLFSGVRKSLDSGTPDVRDHLRAQNPSPSEPHTEAQNLRIQSEKHAHPTPKKTAHAKSETETNKGLNPAPKTTTPITNPALHYRQLRHPKSVTYRRAHGTECWRVAPAPEVIVPGLAAVLECLFCLWHPVQ